MTTRRRKVRGLGWKPGRGTKPHLYLLRDAPPAPAPKVVTSKYWNANGWWGDQGATSQCVIYSWLHVIHDGPIIPVGQRRTSPRPLADPTALYQEAQGYDGTPATYTDSGLSCDAGAKAMKAHQFIGEYRWAESVDEIVNYVLTTGPMVVGAWWYNDMFEPTSSGAISMTGGQAGGHQWVIDGVSTTAERFRDKNSWSRQWGRNGFFSHTFQQMQDMLDEGAELCVFRELPTELPKVA